MTHRLDLVVRAAIHDDIPRLNALIESSARALSAGFYSEAETEAAITHVFGVDSDLVDDGTYLVVEDAGGVLLGCGGWSKRRTLFGGDNFADREDGLLDPATDAAKIRAFFIAPEAARRGVARRLLDECEGRAAAAGFARMELMATMPGVPFYAACGYVPGDQILHRCGDQEVRFVPMARILR